MKTKQTYKIFFSNVPTTIMGMSQDKILCDTWTFDSWLSLIGHVQGETKTHRTIKDLRSGMIVTMKKADFTELVW